MMRKRAIYFSRLFGFACLSMLFCLYVAFMPCVQRKLYNLVLFQAWQFPKGDYQVRSLCGVPAQDVSFKTADGSFLHALYFKHPAAKNTVIIHHGTGMNLTLFLAYAQVFVAGESSVFIYDYRGFGKSSGSPSWKGVCEDGQAAYDYLVKTANLPAKKVLNCGLSLGTGPASYVSANNECGGLLLACPYTSLRKVGREHLPFLNLYPDFLFPETDRDFVKCGVLSLI